MRELPRIKDAIYNEPWAITVSMMDTIACIVERAIEAGPAVRMPEPAPRPKLQVIDGVPVIPVSGVITKKASLFSDISGATSIDNIRSQFQEAMTSDSKAVALLFDTPGGGVQGVAEFASEIFKARNEGGKTILACVDGKCCSAGYWLASQCDSICLTEGSEVGSIGVIAKIQDDSRLKKNAGVDEYVFRSSEMKGAGAGPMTPTQLSGIQAQVMAFSDMFQAAVNRGRAGCKLDLSSFDPATVFIGKKAVDMGLCDSISTLEQQISIYKKQ